MAESAATSDHTRDGDDKPRGSSTEAEAHPDLATQEKQRNSLAVAQDPDLVDWDGPGDPANPRNWSKAHKMADIVLVSMFVLCANLATTMFAPGVSLLATEFGVTSAVVLALCVTIPSVSFSCGPLVFAPLSELYGRRPIYRATSLVYLAFTVGCARSTSVGMFLSFRFLGGCCAASFVTCGGGTIADLLPKEERGVATALFSAGVLVGPVLGPAVGGFVSASIGWRWAFYLVIIFAGILTALTWLIMRETYGAVILARKASRFRKETGKQNLRAVNQSKLPTRQLVARNLIRPLKVLVLSPVVLLVALYLALTFGLIFLLFATMPTVFEGTYHWGIGVSGLAYLGVGIGGIIAIVLFAKLSDRLVMKGDAGGQDNNRGPERRLILMMWIGPAIPIGLFWYGWTAYYQLHCILPIIGTGFVALGMGIITTSAQLYVIDMFGPEGAASALTAMGMVRNTSGAFLALTAPPLYDRFGLGWGNSVLGFVSLVFIPIPVVFYRYGPWLRQKFPVEL